LATAQGVPLRDEQVSVLATRRASLGHQDVGSVSARDGN